MTVDHGRSGAELSDAIKDLPLIGETVEISPGVFFERPNGDLLQALNDLDNRIKYVPVVVPVLDPTAEGSHDVFTKIIDGPLSERIIQDFPDDNPDELEL